MLRDLLIHNFVLIDSLFLTFGSGLNVLSGETGAGKSIVLDALGILLGGRASPELIREGQEEAVVEAVFDIQRAPWVGLGMESLGMDPAPLLTIRRSISRSGRSRVALNGATASVASLRTLARGLVDFSSQNEHQVLLSPSTHLDILDAYGALAALRLEMNRAWQTMKGAASHLQTLLNQQANRMEREEFLRFQLQEMDRINPLAGEDEALDAERKILAHAEKLHSSALAVEQLLYAGRGSVIENIGDALLRLRDISGIDATLAAHVQSLETASYLLEDVARSIGSYSRKVQFNPGRLDELSRRLGELTQLKRKFRTDLAGVVQRLADMRRELALLAAMEDQIEEARSTLASANREATEVAARLTGARKAAAARLEKVAEMEIHSLSLPRARFSIQVMPRWEDETGTSDENSLPGALGSDHVEFHFSANPGEPPRPLTKVASGGELSRVMLALKQSLAGADQVSTFVMDEVDAGIGGAVAEVVGRKLKEISLQRQLLCITHIPQIAAFADVHFSVHKELGADRTRSEVKRLEPSERVEEIARMLGGLEITARARDHARELIERCETYWA